MTEESEKTKQEPRFEGETPLERFSIVATKYIGSTASLVAHSFFFAGIFGLQWLDVSFDRIMLILTTVVSLEAIYLSILIQMTVNRQRYQIAEVSEDVEEIQEDVGEIQEDVGEIQEDVGEIQEDVGEIQEDVGEIQEEVEELSEELSDEADESNAASVHASAEDKSARITKIENSLEALLREIRLLKDAS